MTYNFWEESFKHMDGLFECYSRKDDGTGKHYCIWNPSEQLDAPVSDIGQAMYILDEGEWRLGYQMRAYMTEPGKVFYCDYIWFDHDDIPEGWTEIDTTDDWEHFHNGYWLDVEDTGECDYLAFMAVSGTDPLGYFILQNVKPQIEIRVACTTARGTGRTELLDQKVPPVKVIRIVGMMKKEPIDLNTENWFDIPTDYAQQHFLWIPEFNVWNLPAGWYAHAPEDTREYAEHCRVLGLEKDSIGMAVVDITVKTSPDPLVIENQIRRRAIAELTRLLRGVSEKLKKEQEANQETQHVQNS